MSWYALSAVDDAMDATKGFLFPFDLGRWARLALISIFVGGGFSAVNYAQGVPVDPTPGRVPPEPSGVLGAVDVLSLVALLLLVVLVVGFVVAGPVLRFVLLDALRTGKVRIRDRFRARFWTGLRFLVFLVGTSLLLVVGLVAVFLALTSGGVAILSEVPSPAGSVLGVVVVLLGVGFLLVTAICIYAFFHFTTVFVAPTMVATGSGVVAAWGRFYDLLRAHLGQFVGYLLTRFALGVAVSFLRLFVVLVGLVVVGLAVLLVGGVTALAFGGFDTALQTVAGQVLLGAIALVGLLVYLVVVELPLRIAVLTFFTAYELSVLGLADERLALLPHTPSGTTASTAPDRGRSGAGGEDGDTGDFVFDVARPPDDEEVTDDESTRQESEEDGDIESDDRTDDSSTDDSDDDPSAPYWRS